MIDFDTFARVVEDDITSSGKIGADTCQAWSMLPREEQVVFAPAGKFVGCASDVSPGASGGPVLEKHRILAARLMLLKLGLYQCDPWWSSSVLDGLTSTVLAFPGGAVGDLYNALYGVLGDYPCDLTPTMATFIKEFVVKCFTQQRHSYESVNWRAAATAVNESATKAQLYLAVLAIPPEDLPNEVGRVIEKGLESTHFGQEVHTMLTT